MRNTMILAGAAALALTTPVLAKPGGGNGGGGGGPHGGGGGPAKVERGGGGGPGGGGGGPKAMRGPGGGGGGQAKAMRGGGQQRAERGGGPQRMQMRAPQQRPAKVERRAERQQVRGNGGAAKQQQRVAREQQRQQQRFARGQDRQQQRVLDQRGQREVRVAQDRGRVTLDRRFADFDRNDGRIYRTEQQYAYFSSPAFRTTGLIEGCPPGLAAKGNGCLPPGQAKKLVGAAIPAALGTALLPPLYRTWYPDNDDYYYRTADGYVYRVDRDRNYIDSYWPIADDWTGAYYVGAAYPQDYLGYYNVPVQYQPYYADTDDYYYRYGDGAIYQVDPGNGLIESIVSLLAGGMAVGQPLPAGYDVYNVPYAYRDRYVDTPDAWYRYNDGNIYQVDPTTQIVQAIVASLV